MEAAGGSIHKATLNLIGTIIGAGIFGLPALFSIVGFWPGTLLFWLLALIMLATHIYYADIILAFRKKMRLAGYAHAVLGGWGYVVASVTYLGSMIGVNLIYIILGGSFLAVLVSFAGVQGPLIFWQIVFWFIVALFVASGLSFLAKIETLATWFLLAVMVLAIALSSRTWDFSLLERANWSLFFMPFGVFLFSLSGLNVIPEVVDLAKRHRWAVRTSIFFGTMIAAFLTWAFGVGLYLGAGGLVGRNPGDLIAALPASWGWLIPVLGFLAIITSYLTTAEDLKQSFHLDFHLSPWGAWAIALFLPLLLLLIQQDFLSTVDLVGTVFGGINCLLVIYIAVKLFFKRRTAPAWGWMGSLVLLLVFMVGILHKLLYKPLL